MRGLPKSIARLLSRAGYRISSRLAIIFFLTVIATAVVGSAALRTILPEHPRNQLSERLVLHLIRELGDTPHTGAYDRLARQLGVGLLVASGNRILFSNRRDFPPLEDLAGRLNDADRRISVLFKGDNGKDYYLIRSGDRIFLFSDFVRALSLRGQLALIMAVAAVFGILGISFWAIQKAIAPVRPVYEAARRIERGELEARVENCGNDEIGTLARQFNRMAAALENAERSKREFMIAIGHEFSTPVARVLFQCERIEDPELRDRVRRNLMQISELFRSIITIETISDPWAMSQNEPCPFPDVVRDIVTSMEDMPEIAFDLPRETCMILVNPMKLEILLSNFLGNATRYAPGSPILIRARHDRGILTLRVLDRGPGVPDEFLDQLAMPFSQADRSRRNKGREGTGLGLYLCDRILRNDGGSLHFRNRKGGGLEVIAKLPCPAIS